MPRESSLIHLGLVKMRVTGTGSMSLQLRTFDELNQLNVPTFTLSSTSQYMQTRLTNYIAQAIILRGAAVNQGDSCRVTDITLFVKPIYTEIPA